LRTHQSPTVVFSNTNATKTDGYDVLIDGSGYLTFYKYTGSTSIVSTAPAPIPLNAWTHISASNAFGEARLHINGVRVQTTSVTNSGFIWTGGYRIGAHANGVGGFDGYIGGLVVHDVQLSDNDITLIYDFERTEYTVCGDGITEPGEDCDDGNTSNGDGCSSTCDFEINCGDGIKWPGEACDDGDSLNCGSCNADCSAVNSPAIECPRPASDMGVTHGLQRRRRAVCHKR
jgi:cysteine-rich repeat protein